MLDNDKWIEDTLREGQRETGQKVNKVSEWKTKNVDT